jgi:hypothetical protein
MAGESCDFPAMIELAPVAFPWRMLPLSCSMVVTGALVLARRSGTRIARAFFFLAVAYGLHWMFFFGGPPVQTYAWIAVFFCASLVMLPLILRAVLIFPRPAPPDGRIHAGRGCSASVDLLELIYGVPAAGSGLSRRLRRQRRLHHGAARGGDAEFPPRQCERPATAMAVLGTYLGTAPVLLADVAAAIAPPLWWLRSGRRRRIAIPLCVLIAIVRSLPRRRPADPATAVYSSCRWPWSRPPRCRRSRAPAAATTWIRAPCSSRSMIVAMCIVPASAGCGRAWSGSSARASRFARWGGESLRDLAAVVGPDGLWR